MTTTGRPDVVPAFRLRGPSRLRGGAGEYGAGVALLVYCLMIGVRASGAGLTRRFGELVGDALFTSLSPSVVLLGVPFTFMPPPSKPEFIWDGGDICADRAGLLRSFVMVFCGSLDRNIALMTGELAMFCCLLPLPRRSSSCEAFFAEICADISLLDFVLSTGTFGDLVLRDVGAARRFALDGRALSVRGIPVALVSPSLSTLRLTVLDFVLRVGVTLGPRALGDIFAGLASMVLTVVALRNVR